LKHVNKCSIVFVPGLGADPEDSWKSEKSGFNWATDDKTGLARDFPRSRILLYEYESAWTGPLKVNQYLSNIAMTLLWALNGVREKCRQRPIVFIGHSMGGLVIAKAIVLSDSRIDKFPKLFESIVACSFFGTPFKGTAIASAAWMLSKVGAKLDVAASSKLLELMEEGNESLRELVNDFLRLAKKLNPGIDLHCFWEEQPTDFSAKTGVAANFFTKLILTKGEDKLVNETSARLDGYENTGLACNHRNLVRFDDGKDDTRYSLVRVPLKQLINGAALAGKNRLNATRDVDPDVVNNIMDVLSGAQISRKRKILDQKFSPSSWIPKEKEFLDWLNIKNPELEGYDARRGDALFIKGSEGRGKTSATMAALNGIDNIIEQQNSGHFPIIVAYFFCDPTADYSTAEDLLKSLVRQLINQQIALAPYAKQFMKKKGEKKLGEDKAQMSVEHLWQTLEDMLSDDSILGRVYFVINNLHSLPEDNVSTIKLMGYLKSEVQELKTTGSKRVPVRWFFTSREAKNVEEAILGDGVRLIDLENESYWDQVQLELRKHASKKIESLASTKKYNKALSYFASSLLGKRASNSQWIDITCVQLEELPESEPDLKVRRVLERLPQNLNLLLEHAWMQVFKVNEDRVDQIKELLRTLVLCYEDPTEEELGILAGFSSSEAEKEELRDLIAKCKPLLVTKRVGKSDNQVAFMNVVIKNHLLDPEHARKLLGLAEVEIKWQHGMMALRSLNHVKEAFKSPEDEIPIDATAAENVNSGAAEDVAEDDKENVNEATTGDAGAKEGEEEPEHDNGQEQDDEAVEEEDEEEEDEEEEVAENSYDTDDDEDMADRWNDEPQKDLTSEEEDAMKWNDKGLQYIVKNWLHHAGKATAEIADDLGDDDFWHEDSLVRFRWLREYSRLTGHLEYFDHTTLTALHIAASVGFRQLVKVLIKKGHDKEINKQDSLWNTPVSLESLSAISY
jgi:hypothetical protein